MPTVSNTFTELYAPGLRKVMFEAFNYMESQYRGFLRTGSSQRQYEEEYKMGGFGSVPVKLEGEAIIYDDPVPGSKVRFDWTPRGKGFRVTKEAMDDDLYGPMAQMATSIGRAFRNQTELIAASILDNAFTNPAATANNSGYDGLSLCNTAHPLLRGGTASNRPAADVDLSFTAIQDALVDFERWVDESGVPIVMPARRIVISPEQEPLLKKILGSDLQPSHTADLGSATDVAAQNATNILRNRLTVTISHFKSDLDAWFIMGSPDDTDVWLTWRVPYQTEASDDFDTGDGKLKGYMRLGVGYGDWRGVWGTSGA